MMASCNSHKTFIFIFFFPAFVLPFAISNPIPDSLYNKFIYFLSKDNCSMPNELKLPFPNSSDPSSFNYLSTPLKECQTPEALEEYSEANMLCTEVFDVLKNITCVRYDESLSTIESDRLSTNICHDFKSLKDILPQKDNYLSGRLSDDVICKVLCTAENYELLCKTLLWSYDTLMKIKHALPNEVQENENGSITKVSSDKVNSSAMPSSVSVESKQNVQNINESDKSKNVDPLHQSEENLLGSNLNQTDQEPHNPEISGDLSKVISEDTSNKKVSPDPKIQDEPINKTADITKDAAITVLQNKSEPQNQKLYSEVAENNMKSPESKNLSSLYPQPEHGDDNENKINVDEKFPKKEVKDNSPEADLNTNSLTFNANGIKDDQNNKNVTVDNMLNNNYGKNDVNGNVGAKPIGKTEEPVTPITGNDNELKNNFLEEDDKLKAKQTDLENQEVKEIEKPKQTDYEGPNEVLPDNDSKLPDFSTQSVLPDEDIEQQEDKDQEQYNDIENEGDYAKPEYENSFNLPSKNKESEIKSSIAATSNQMMNGYDNNISPKNNIARMTEEIAMIAPFPEQEDSHFFFYFLSIVLIIMAGYLIFHNKQKIIALIVEGRHERRRRSHGAGYKKLETK